MAFYLYRASYTAAAIKAMVAQPEDREAAARKAIEALGGTLHQFFFALGEDDIIAILEAPDDAAVAAGSMVVAASGSFSSVTTTKLLTMAEAMAAMGKANAVVSAYAAPGG